MNLKPRELEVLRLMADGLSNREISEQLYIGVETVKWYAKSIYSKLDVSNRKEAAHKAEELGLLSVSHSEDYFGIKHNLPEQSTSFIGRNANIEQINALLFNEDVHLITILASGGMGKTRLSIEVAKSQIENYRDGVYFVPLAPLSSADDIVTTISENIGLVLHSDNTIAQLVDFLKERTILLILDNFEHLLEGVSLVTDVIESSTQVKVVVTSRERLNISGEHVYYLSGMTFPTWETPEDALNYDAVKLFMQSAHRTRTDFELGSGELDFLARICKLTEGMPLGIELAAGWIDVLSLEQIAHEIQNGIDIFETEMRDIPDRHRSLRATFERTWQRLSDAQRNIFMKLSVFRGGFTLQAAQIITGANVRDLRKLSQKALIQNDGSERYTIHELLRQFGESKLEEHAISAAVKEKHAHFFADFMAEREQDLKNGRQLKGLTLIDPDFENIRLAWFFITNHHQWEQVPKFRYSLWFYCDTRSREQDLIFMLEYALQILWELPLSDKVQVTIGRLLAWLSWFFSKLGFSNSATKNSHEAISILTGIDDALEDLIIAYHTLGNMANFVPDNEISLPIAKQNYELAKRLGDLTWMGQTATFTAFVGVIEADYLKLATQHFKSTGDQHGLWMCTMGEALLLFDQNNLEDFIKRLKYAESLIAPFNSATHLAETNRGLGLSMFLKGDSVEALYHYSKAIRLLWNAGYNNVLFNILLRMAQVYIYEDYYDIAIATVLLLEDIPLEKFKSDYERDSLFNLQITYDELRSDLEQKLISEQLEHLWLEIKKPSLGELVYSVLANSDKRFE